MTTYKKKIDLFEITQTYVQVWGLYGSLLKTFWGLWGSRENIFEREATFLILPSQWILAFSPGSEPESTQVYITLLKLNLWFLFFSFISHTFRFNFIWQLGSGRFLFLLNQVIQPCFFIKESLLTLIFDSQTLNFLKPPILPQCPVPFFHIRLRSVLTLLSEKPWGMGAANARNVI